MLKAMKIIESQDVVMVHPMTTNQLAGLKSGLSSFGIEYQLSQEREQAPGSAVKEVGSSKQVEKPKAPDAVTATGQVLQDRYEALDDSKEVQRSGALIDAAIGGPLQLLDDAAKKVAIEVRMLIQEGSLHPTFPESLLSELENAVEDLKMLFIRRF